MTASGHEVSSLSARSTVLTLLLGIDPPELAASEIVAAGVMFGLSESTVRVALTRMVAAAELDRQEAVYRLSDRMLARRAEWASALDPEVHGWGGGWETVVVTETGRSAPARVRLRAALTALRLAELREGVWMRPANLRRPVPAAVEYVVLHGARPEDGAGLAARLWPLEEWAQAALVLERGLAATEPAEQLAAGAAIFRHLLSDPVLPSALAPVGWPAQALRRRYADFVASTTAMVRTGIT